MKNKHFWIILAGIAFLLLSACKKEEDDSDPLVLEITYSFLDEHTVHFEHNDVGEGVPYWDFGNGEVGHDDEATVVYPLAGTYMVILTMTSEAGTLKDTVNVTITSSNPDLIELTAEEVMLCGGSDSLNGKTWVWAEGVAQHMMVAQYDPWVWWWGSAPYEKEPFNMYDDRMIFKAVNHEFRLVNNDSTYVNVDYLGDFGITGTGDMTVYYDLSTAEFSWELDQRGGGLYLILSNGGFMSYYDGISEYRVEILNDNELTVSTLNDNVFWQYKFMRLGFDHPDAVDPEEPPVNENLSPATNIDQLVDDFETDAEILWLFQAENGGGSGDDEAENPDRSGIDTSYTVYKYVKGGFAYSNANIELGFDIDLNTHNRVSMKVYFPSSNSYTAGETGLKPKASVKLQRWEELSPWVNQAEVINEEVPLDEWTELIFDYTTISIPSNRMSGYFDKIVIQFGDEGHTENGNFYFDDFTFLPAE